MISFIAKQFSPEILKFSAHIFGGRWGRKDPLVSDTKFVVDSFTFISQRIKETFAVTFPGHMIPPFFL